VKNPGTEITDRVEQVVLLTKKRIDDFLAGEYKEHFGSTSLAKDIVKSTGYSMGFVGSIVSQYIELHDEVESTKGRNGGVRRKKKDES
jgi:hypothetical protein